MEEIKAEKNNEQLSSTKVPANIYSFSLPDTKTHIIFWILAVGGLALDLWTKTAVFNWLKQQPYNDYSVIDGFMRLIMAENNGAAWSILSGKTFFLVSVSVVALFLIVAVFLVSGKQSRLIHISMGLFAAGVSGNLYDRIFNKGHVRDFVDVYYRDFHWPTFNVADSLLCIGVALLIISTILLEVYSRKQAQHN